MPPEKKLTPLATKRTSKRVVDKLKSFLANIVYEIAARDIAWPVLPVIMADTATGEIFYASKSAAGIFGYEPRELVGQVVEILVPESQRDVHVNYRQDASVPKTRLMGVGRQLWGRKKDGILFPIHVGLTAMEVANKSIGIAFVIDLTGIYDPVSTGHGVPVSDDTPSGILRRKPVNPAPPPSDSEIPIIQPSSSESSRLVPPE